MKKRWRGVVGFFQSLETFGLAFLLVASVARAQTADVIPTNGPYAGGILVMITNATSDIGDGADITNIVVGGVGTTDIVGQGLNWVLFLMPQVNSPGFMDVTIQSTSVGDRLLPGAYQVNPAGGIDDYLPEGWGEIPGLATGIYGLAAAVYSNQMYAIGGYGGGVIRTNVYCYDGQEWTEVAGLPAPRWQLGAEVFLGSHLYAMGGYGGGAIQSNVYRFNGAVWEEVAGLPTSVQCMAVGGTSGGLYCAGGESTDGILTNLFVFDGSSWSEVAGLPQPRAMMGGGVLFNELTLVGGWDGASPQTNVFAYTGASWYEPRGLPLARRGLACAGLPAALFVMGGYASGAAQTNLFRFMGGTWTEESGMPVARWLHAGCAFQGDVFVLGGDDGSFNGSSNVIRYNLSAVGVVPPSGTTRGGFTVTITGSNLCDGTMGDVTDVTLCGVNATSIDSCSPTCIVVMADAGTPGLGDVRVFSTSYGETVKSNAFTYAGPSILVAGPAFGHWPVGSSVTNTFTVTNAGNEVLLITGATNDGTGAANFTVMMPSEVAPGTASNFPVVFSPGALGAFVAECYTENNTVYSNYSFGLIGKGYEISASSGPFAGGNTVTITNGDFGTLTNVLVGGVVATIEDSGANWVRLTMPAVGSAGVKAILLQTSDVGDTLLARAYTVNPAGVIGIPTDVWTEVEPLPRAISYLTCGTLGPSLYSVAGALFMGYASNVYQYAGGGWTEAPGLPTNCSAAAMAPLHGHLYHSGGMNGDYVSITNVYEFDGSSWMETAGLPTQMYGHATAALGGQLYTFGGDYNWSLIPHSYSYDGTNWQVGTALPTQLIYGAAVAFQDAIYWIGGWDLTDGKTNVYRYDGATFTEVAGLPAPRYLAGAAVRNDRLYVYGGHRGLTNTFCFDGTNWSEVAGMPAARWALAGGAYDNNLYALGGFDTEDNVTSNVYRYGAIFVGGVEPSSGPVTGGYPVVISGLNLGDGADITNVTLCGVDVLSIESQSATQVVVLAQAAAVTGIGNVRISSISFGETVKPNAFTYLREPQAPLVFNPASPQSYGTTNALYVSGGSGTGAVSYTVLIGPGQIVDSTNLAVTASTGTILVRATKAMDDLYFEAAVTGTVTAAKAAAGVYLLNLSQAYNGAARMVSATTDPSGLTVVFTYDGNPWAPTNIGSYAVTGTVVSADWAGSASDTLTVTKGIQNIVFPGIPPRKVAAVVGLSATGGGSGNPVTFAVASGPGAIDGTGTNLSFSAVGDVAVVASQAGNADYNAALPVTNVVKVYSVLPEQGPFAGGNTVTITNGFLGTITNVTVGGVVATIQASGENWVRLTMPAATMAGLKDIVIQTTGPLAPFLRNAYAYNPAGQIGWGVLRWSEAPALPKTLSALACGVLDSGLHTAGGHTGVGPVSNVYRSAGGPWLSMPPLPVSCSGGALAALNGRLYHIGGVDNDFYGLTNVFMYDGTNWTEVAGLPYELYYHAAATLDGRIYTLGGKGDFGYESDSYRFDGTNWAVAAALPAERIQCGGIEFMGALYYVAGFGLGEAATNVYRFDGATFTEVAGLSTGLCLFGAAARENLLYVYGGETARTNAYAFDGTNWMEIAGMPAGRDGLAGAAFENTLYAIGGVDAGDLAHSNVYRYGTVLEGGATPASGSITGGYPVTIVGVNLGDGTDITNVTLCGANVASIVSQSATQVVVMAGAGSVGLGGVRIYSTSFGETFKAGIFTYTRGTQTITFPPIPTQTERDVYGLAASANSGLAVTFQVVAGPGQITGPGGTNLSFTGPGFVSVRAMQGGNADWFPATPVTNTFRVLGYFAVTIESPHGSTLPAAGVYTNLELSVFTNIVVTPDIQGTTQYLCYGWAATENLDPAGGTGTQAVVTVNGAGTLTWLWTTEYYLTPSAGPHGTIDRIAGWFTNGAVVAINATPDAYYHFTNWTGSTLSMDNPLNLLMDEAKWVTANFIENWTTNRPTPEWWLAQYGITDRFEEAVGEDPDNDAVATGDEFGTDTLPTNTDSFLRMQWIGAGGAAVRWAGGTGVVQYLEWRGDAWDDVHWIVLSTNLPPTAVTNETPVPGAGPQGFYRIRTVR